jgi:hypothetical protein
MPMIAGIIFALVSLLEENSRRRVPCRPIPLKGARWLVRRDDLHAPKRTGPKTMPSSTLKNSSVLSQPCLDRVAGLIGHCRRHRATSLSQAVNHQRRFFLRMASKLGNVRKLTRLRNGARTVRRWLCETQFSRWFSLPEA